MEYNLRKPNTKDLFIACKIASGIGVKNIYNCFNSDEIEDIKKLVKNQNEPEVEKIGYMVLASITDLILSKIEDVGTPLIKFMSNLSGLKVKEIEELSPAEFMEMLVKILKMPECMDFIKVVLKLSN